jgi:hypothetical protein
MKKFTEYIAEEKKAKAKPKPEGKLSRLEKAVSKIEKLTKAKTKKPAEKKPEKLDPPAKNPVRVMAFGKFDIPTSGHEGMIDQAKKLAVKYGGTLRVVASHSDDKDRKTRMKHFIRAFPDVSLEIADKDQSTIMHHIRRAHQEGNKHLVVVAAGGKAKEFQTFLDNYNGTPAAGYKFDSIKVVDGVKPGPGIVPSSELHSHAKKGDFESFKNGLASGLRNNFLYAKEVYRDARRKKDKK